MRYTFWYQRSVRHNDAQWLLSSVNRLKNNEWTDTLYIDGIHNDKSALHKAACCQLLLALSENPSSAKSLTLRNVRLDNDVGSALHAATEKTRDLEKLSLYDIRGSCGEEWILAPELLQSTMLTELSLAKFGLDEKGCESLSNTIGCSESLLNSLTLEGVNVTSGFSHITSAVAVSQSLKHLVIKGMHLSLENMSLLLDALAVNTSLVSVHLEKLSLRKVHAKMLANFISNNGHMQELSLRKNEICHDSVKILMEEGLSRNVCISRLYLSSNPIGDEGMQHVISCLTNNNTLRELCLVDTNIGRQGCLALASGLPFIQSVQKLSMDKNEIKSCGAEILEGMQHNMVIRQLVEEPRAFTITSRAGEDEKLSGIWQEIDLMLRFNKAKRRFLTDSAVHETTLFPFVVAAASRQPDVLFCMIREMPTIAS